jgi:hypothetical protein
VPSVIVAGFIGMANDDGVEVIVKLFMTVLVAFASNPILPTSSFATTRISYLLHTTG